MNTHSIYLLCVHEMDSIRRRFGPNSYNEDVWAAADVYDSLCFERGTVVEKKRFFFEYVQKRFGLQYMHDVVSQVKEIAWKLYLDDVSILNNDEHCRQLKKNLAILGFQVY